MTMQERSHWLTERVAGLRLLEEVGLQNAIEDTFPTVRWRAFETFVVEIERGRFRSGLLNLATSLLGCLRYNAHQRLSCKPA